MQSGLIFPSSDYYGMGALMIIELSINAAREPADTIARVTNACAAGETGDKLHHELGWKSESEKRFTISLFYLDMS